MVWWGISLQLVSILGQSCSFDAVRTEKQEIKCLMKQWEALTGQVYQKHQVPPEMQHKATCILTMSYTGHSTPPKHRSLSGSIVSQAQCVTSTMY